LIGDEVGDNTLQGSMRQGDTSQSHIRRRSANKHTRQQIRVGPATGVIERSRGWWGGSNGGVNWRTSGAVARVKL